MHEYESVFCLGKGWQDGKELDIYNDLEQRTNNLFFEVKLRLHLFCNNLALLML